MATSTIIDQEAITRFEELVRDIKFAMLTTLDPKGGLRARPMAVLKSKFDGDLWFFTEDDSPKVDEVLEDRHVGLTLANPPDKFVSITGKASLVRDAKRQEELWTPFAKAWFPRGPHDPHLALLRVRVEAIEYWDIPASKMVRLFSLAKASMTGKRPENLGDHRHIDLTPKSELM